MTNFSEGSSVLITKQKYSNSLPSKKDNCALSFSGFNTWDTTNLLSLSQVPDFEKTPFFNSKEVATQHGFDVVHSKWVKSRDFDFKLIKN